MAFNRRNNGRFHKPNFKAKTVGCSCGGTAKLFTRRHYPFGSKSKALVSQTYECSSCDKVTFLNKDTGGKK